MNSINTKAIVLTRINYGEADRIVTFLTPNNGKLRLIAKGVRKIKSKLAGGIELFSENNISYLAGKSDIGTLISSRMEVAYPNIVKDLARVQLGYDLIKLINKVTEDHPDEDYYLLLRSLYKALDTDVNGAILYCWFKAQLLKLAGHSPNLYSDISGKKLDESTKYSFDLEAMTFTSSKAATISSKQIKALRLMFSDHEPKVLDKVEGMNNIALSLESIVDSMVKSHLNV